MRLYLSNWYHWWRETTGGFAETWRDIFPTARAFWWRWFWQQLLDRGLNTLYGGDPYMTISGRVWRDRRHNVLLRAFNWLLSVVFHRDGPGDKDWPHHGEGSSHDRTLPNPLQGVAIVFGLLVTWSTLSSLIRLDFDWSVPMLIFRLLSVVI